MDEVKQEPWKPSHSCFLNPDMACAETIDGIVMLHMRSTQSSFYCNISSPDVWICVLGIWSLAQWFHLIDLPFWILLYCVVWPFDNRWSKKNVSLFSMSEMLKVIREEELPSRIVISFSINYWNSRKREAEKFIEGNWMKAPVSLRQANEQGWLIIIIAQ